MSVSVTIMSNGTPFSMASMFGYVAAFTLYCLFWASARSYLISQRLTTSISGEDCNWGKYLLLTLPQPITATLIFFALVATAQLSREETSNPAPAKAVIFKNRSLEILSFIRGEFSVVK